MDSTITQYLLVGVILLAGSTLQGIVGFASGLFSIPLLLHAGIALPHALALNLVATTVQSSLGAWKLSESIPWRSTIRPIAIRLLTLPLGAAVLYMSRDWDRALVKQTIGVVLLAALAGQTLWRVEPREQLHAAWEWLAFSVSGLLAGFCGMGGAPMVLWVLAHRWSSSRSRAFLFYLFVGGIPPQAALLLFLFGWPILQTFGNALLLTPFTLTGAVCGLKIGAALPSGRSRALTWVVLALIAASAIAAPWL